MIYRSALRDGAGFLEFPLRTDSYERAVANSTLPDHSERVRDGDETEPNLGLLRRQGGEEHQRSSLDEMTRAVLEAEHAHADDGAKYILLDVIDQVMRPDVQQKSLEQVSEAQFKENRHLFVDRHGELLPVIAFWLVCSDGAEGGLQKKRAKLDPRWLYSYNGIPIGGPMGGAKRLVLVGSPEHERLLRPEVASTNVVECVFLLTLPDVVVLAIRR